MNLYLLVNKHQFWEPSKKEDFIRIFSKHINNYQVQNKNLFILCHKEISITIDENKLCYCPARVYDWIEDLAKTIMYPANCHTSNMILLAKGNFNFALPKPVYIYTDIIKPDLVGDCYMRLLTTLHLTSNTG